MNWVASPLATRRGCAKWKVFVGRRVGKGAINKRKERIVFRPEHLRLGGRGGKSFYHADFHFFLWTMKKTHKTDDLIGLDQNIPGWLIKMTFLGEVETIRYSIYVLYCYLTKGVHLPVCIKAQ